MYAFFPNLDCTRVTLRQELKMVGGAKSATAEMGHTFDSGCRGFIEGDNVFAAEWVPGFLDLWLLALALLRVPGDTKVPWSRNMTILAQYQERDTTTFQTLHLHRHLGLNI